MNVPETLTARLRLTAEHLTNTNLSVPADADQGLIDTILAECYPADMPAGSDIETKTRFLTTVQITEDNLVQTFGPEWATVVGLIRTAATFTDEENARLQLAWTSAQTIQTVNPSDSPRLMSRNALQGAVDNARRMPATMAAWNTTAVTNRNPAVSGAARAVIARDLISADGFTQESYDFITGPFRKTIGKLHADDADLMVAA